MIPILMAVLVICVAVMLMVLTTSIIDVGVNILYPGSPGELTDPSAIQGKVIQPIMLTVSATGAAGWAKVATIDTKTAQKLGNIACKPNAKYAIAWVWGFSATGVSIRFKHSSWGSCQPGGHLGSLLHQRRDLLDFARMGGLPTFNANNPCDVYVYTNANETPGMILVGLVEL